jgi:hypothetical protein
LSSCQSSVEPFLFGRPVWQNERHAGFAQKPQVGDLREAQPRMQLQVLLFPAPDDPAVVTTTWSLAHGYPLSGGVKLASPTEGGCIRGVDAGELELAGIVHFTGSDWPQRVFPAIEATGTAPFEDNGGDG